MSLLLLALSLLMINPQQYYIELGNENTGYGITMTNLGDGKNIAGVLGGKQCRITDLKSGGRMLYFNVDSNYKLNDKIFIIVEYFDQTGTIGMQYDSGLGGSAYLDSPDKYKQENTKKWRTAVFIARRPAFKNRQNGENDFRIMSDGVLAVSKVALADDPPKGYVITMDPNEKFAQRPATKVPAGMDVIQQWQVHEPLDESLLQDSPYEICKKIGITSLQSYVGWAQIEPEPNKITYDVYDPVVAQIKKHDLKWLPFIITGPYIATPKWFRETQGVDAVCLEHNTPIRIQSIWNPNLKQGVRRFLELFKDHYDPSSIEALNFGISGNWGESIFPAGGGFDMQGVHTHGGWWCGDKYAKADFQRWLKEKYASINSLNSAWSSSYADFDSISPFIPNESKSKRAAVDMSYWYTQSMTDYAELWIKTARELYPELPIYLCTGGNGQIELGADFAAQSRMCAKYNAGIRITNMNDDMLYGFAITRMVSSATRLYKGYYTTEPGGDTSPKGMAGRIFDIVSGGGIGVYFKGLHQAPDLATENALVFADYAKYMIPNEPKLTTAVIMPNAAIATGPTLDNFISRTAKLRDALDYEFIDENMINDGLLKNFKAVFMVAGNILEQSTIDKLDEWIKSGGVFIMSADSNHLKSVDGNDNPWFKISNELKIPMEIKYAGGKLSGVKVNIGSRDESTLSTPWHGAEGQSSVPTDEDPDPTYRWTMASSSITLPLPSKQPLVLRVLLSVPEANAKKAKILVNGVKIADLWEVDRKWIEIPIPAKAIKPTGNMKIAFESDTMLPGPNDPRKLGLQIFEIQLLAKGTPPQLIVDADKLSPEITFDEAKVFPLIAGSYGKGYAVMWPQGWDTYMHFLNIALHTEKAPWEQLSEPLDCQYDNIMACRAGDMVYYLNNGDIPFSGKTAIGKRVSVKPRSLISAKHPK